MDKKEQLELYKEQLSNGTLKENLKESFIENIKNDIFICRNLNIEDYYGIISSDNLLYNIINIYRRRMYCRLDAINFTNSVTKFIHDNMLNDMHNFIVTVRSVLDGDHITLESYISHLFYTTKELNESELYFIKFLIVYFYKQSKVDDILSLCSDLAFQILNNLFKYCDKFEFFKIKEIDINTFMGKFYIIESSGKYKISDLYKYFYCINLPDFLDYNDDFYIMIDIYMKLKEYEIEKHEKDYYI